MADESVQLATVPITNIDLLRCIVGVKVSNGKQDRSGDIVLPGALDLTNHKKIPIALFEHDVSFPVGVCETREEKQYTVRQEGQDVLADIAFNQADYRAMQVFDFVAQGIIRGCSPKFIAKQWERNPNDPSGYGRIYKQAELIEVSICMIPDNPDATVQWVQKTLNVSKNIDPIIIKHLKQFNYDVRETVSATVPATPPADTPPAATPPAATPPVVVAKTDSGDEETTELPPGAKALDSIHTMALAFKSKLMKIAKGQESPAVKEYIEELSSSIDEMTATCAETYKSNYPDAPELKATPGSEDEIPIEDVKNLKMYEREFKKLKNGYVSKCAEVSRKDAEIDRLNRKLAKQPA